MKITIIGTTSYKSKMIIYKESMKKDGHEIKIPAFDDHPDLDDYGVCMYNRDLIEWADEVHIFWDQRSLGTVFDFGMCFALRKKTKIVYLEKKTFKGVMEKYSADNKHQRR